MHKNEFADAKNWLNLIYPITAFNVYKLSVISYINFRNEINNLWNSNFLPRAERDSN